MIDRRQILAGLAAITVIPLPAFATPDEVAAAILATFGDRPMTEGPITIEAPPLAETGNSVPVTLRVDRPMAAADRILRLALFTERNPRPKVFEAAFGPAAAEAVVTTNIRLNGTQTILCVAEAADGSLIRAAQEIRVVVGACTTLEIQF